MIGISLLSIAYFSKVSLEHVLISQQFNHTKAVAQNALILEARDFIEPSSVEAQNQFHRYVEEFKDPTIHEINIFDLNGRL